MTNVAPPAVDSIVKWTDVLGSLGTAVGALGTLATLVFVALQLKQQSKSLRDQRDASVEGLKAVGEQIAAQTRQTAYVAEQTRLQTQQAEHVAEQTRLLGQQVEVLAHSNKSILYQNVTKEMQEITKIFFCEPALRAYFYDGLPVSQNPDLEDRVRVLAEMFVDFMAFTLNTNVLFDDENRASWRRYFEHIAASSPAIRDFWRENGEWYESPVREVLDPVVDATERRRPAS